jgi:two-component system sensor histidine kinase CpxA
MNRLYWRIFLAFWLVIVITVVFAISASTLSFLAELDSARVEGLRASIEARSGDGQEALDTGGPDGLRDWLATQMQEHPVPPIFVITPDDRELLGRRMNPPPPWRLVRRLRDESPDPSHPGLRAFPAHVLKAANGDKYLLLTEFHPRPPGGWFFSPENRLLVLGIALLASGTICFFLARHLTRPIRALRRTGLAIADGDLSARVADGVPERPDEFGALARDFNHMADRVQGLMSARQKLLRDVSHELRSPLARLQVAAGLARQRGGNEVEREINRIELEAERLNELIGRILSFTRMESMESISRSAVDLAELVESLVEDARFEAGTNGKEVLLQSLPEAGIAANEPLLRSCIENVLRNAIEHARRRVLVTVAAGSGGDGFRVSILDDGPGVGEEHLGQLTEPFYTAPVEDGHEVRRRGTGLGLAISRRAIELHGGSIAIERAPNGGLLVMLVIPAQRPAKA